MHRLLGVFSLCLALSPNIVQAFYVPSSSTFGQQSHLVTSPSSSVLFATPTPIMAGILGRFRKKREVVDQPVNPIQVGEVIKDGDVECLSNSADDEEAERDDAVSILKVLGKGKAILIGMPGAFTPTCSQKHLPGYVKKADNFAALGYNTIAVVTTNDKFVNQEWLNTQGIADSKAITMLSDGDGDFVKSLGLADDMGFGVGVRSKRFALVTDNGKVTHLLTDEGMSTCASTSADSLLAVLTPEVELSENGDSSAVVLGVVAAVIALAVGLQSFGGGGGVTVAPSSSSAPAIMKTEPGRKGPGSDKGFSMLKNVM